MLRTLLRLLLAIGTVACCSSVFAQDVLTVGGGWIVARPGDVVQVPVYIRDAAGTALGFDQPYGIASYAFRLVSSAPDLLTLKSDQTIDASYTTSGVTSPLGAPDFQQTTTTPSGAGFAIQYQRNIPLVTRTGVGDLVGYVSVRVSPSTPVYSTIYLNVDSSKAVTLLTDVSATFSENCAAGDLVVGGAYIYVD